MGRHRSVAMVELLSKMPWPGWNVKIVHRDISNKNGKQMKGREKVSRMNRGGSSFLDDDSE